MPKFNPWVAVLAFNVEPPDSDEGTVRFYGLLDLTPEWLEGAIKICRYVESIHKKKGKHKQFGFCEPHGGFYQIEAFFDFWLAPAEEFETMGAEIPEVLPHAPVLLKTSKPAQDVMNSVNALGITNPDDPDDQRMVEASLVAFMGDHVHFIGWAYFAKDEHRPVEATCEVRRATLEQWLDAMRSKKRRR